MDGDRRASAAPDPAARLAAFGLDLGGALSVESYIEEFDGQEPFAAYNKVPPAIEERCAAIAEIGGGEAVETYHQLVLATLVDGFDRRAKAAGLPAWLEAQTLAYLKEILEAAARPGRRRLRLEQDDFLKDLAVCRLKLWPLGVELVDVNAGLQKRIALGGVRQALGAACHVGLSLGGFRPFLETHFDARRARAFSADGYRRLYLAIARLMRDRPAYRGLVSTSWWHDPAVGAISPTLAFLNDLPLGAGARIYRMHSDQQTVKSATRLSKERTRLYREGAYLPTNYTLAWGRRDLLRWADAQEPSQGFQAK